MKRGYGQYCPLALATEVLGKRWTVLVISRLFDGCALFNEIHHGLPRISPSQLSQRLAELEHAGVVRRKKLKNQHGYSYHLTAAGKDLEDIVMQMAVWGQRWARDMTSDDLDPAFLAWSMHLRMHGAAMPPGRTVIEFELATAPKGYERFWLINNDGNIDMCLKHPGFDTDLLVAAELQLFVEAWRGFRDLRKEISARRIRLTGPTTLKKEFPNWLMLSALAPYERLLPGRERSLGK